MVANCLLELKDPLVLFYSSPSHRGCLGIKSAKGLTIRAILVHFEIVSILNTLQSSNYSQLCPVADIVHKMPLNCSACGSEVFGSPRAE